MRDMDENPYGIQEQRVVEFLATLSDEPPGHDPVGLLMAMYTLANSDLARLRSAAATLSRTVDHLTDALEKEKT